MKSVQVNNLYEYIDLLKDRAPMFIGSKSITALKNHLDGYQMAIMFKGINEELKPDFSKFHDFVAAYYAYGESTAGWKNMILRESFGDEQYALEDFFKLQELFREGYDPTDSKKILYQILNKIILTPENMKLFRTESSFSTLNKFNEIFQKLSEIKYSFEYDDLLEELRLLPSENELFNKLKK